ncbi:MAG: redoxin domain-containing protein [Clostridia bacterium]|nr:redoxin domain-containing protein [Clostridia bacterium]
MTKKEIILAIVMFILIFSTLTILVFILVSRESTTPLPNAGLNSKEELGLFKGDIPSTGNDTLLNTKSETKIRIINEYDKNLFTAKKNLLIMFGSWCPNCQEELVEIEKILNYYKDNKDVNILVIAHEFNNSDYPLTDIISLTENDVNFGDIEVLVDFSRIIRKNIDPDENTVPVSYVVDKKGNILSKHSNSLTFEKAQEMLK